MANEVMVPLLPCASIDDMAEFYEMPGFRRTYRQLKPNPYVVVQREDIHLHFFGMPGLRSRELLRQLPTGAGHRRAVRGVRRRDAVGAARILDGALSREGASASAGDWVEALVYGAELAIRMGKSEKADPLLA
jgi:hypothetical protein